MKKIVLLLPIIFLCSILTYCNENATSDTKFTIKQLTKEEYLQNPSKAVIDIHDSIIQEKINALDCYFSKRVDSLGFNGAVLISYKGTPILEGYYGYANYNKKIKLNKSKTFQIASTSKTFTSGAILLLAQEGYLNLDDTIQKFFPNFPYQNITIRLLLNHRSGLPDYLDFSEKYWVNKNSYMSNDDVLNQLIKFKPKPLSNPNTAFKYNNTNFVLLALIIEKVSGYSYPEFMKKFFFEPLSMTNTYVFSPYRQLEKEVKGYSGKYWKEDKIVYTDGVYGDKGIYSTVSDLYKWDQALYTGKLIKPQILNLAFTPQSFENPGTKNYGLGWRMRDQPDGNRIVYHNGWWHSFNTVFNRKINDGTCIIILSSHYSTSVYKIQEIWDILYGVNEINITSD